MNKESMSTPKVKIVFPRRSSNKPVPSYISSTTHGNKPKSTQHMANRRSPTERAFKAKEAATTRQLLEKKNKLAYSPMHIYNKPTNIAFGNSTPINYRGPKSISSKGGKIAHSDRNRLTGSTAVKRVSKAKRNEMRANKILDKEPQNTDSIEKMDSKRKASHASYNNDSKRGLKIGLVISSKSSAGKIYNKKASPKRQGDIIDCKTVIPNTKSVEKIETLKYSNKIKPILVS